MLKNQKVFNCIIILLLSGMCIYTTGLYRLPHKIKKRIQKGAKGTYNHWIHLWTRFPVIEDKPLVVVITSYNNEKYCEANLRSVFEQTYNNYRVIFIDDCSSDNTYSSVKKLIEESGMKNKVTLIRNKTRKQKFPNMYTAFCQCKDHEIIATLDGDDRLAHPRVLERINEFYQNPDVWLTYGSAVTHPGYRTISGRKIPDNILDASSLRDTGKFDLSMLRTFYAGLVKQIKLKDFFYREKFMPTADDAAFMYPMLELAPTHSLYVYEVLYIINDENPIREQCTMTSLQVQMLNHIQNKEKYSPLPSSFDPRYPNQSEELKPLDLIVFSSDTPLLLDGALGSYQKYLPRNNITVYYSASDLKYENAYQNVSHVYPKITFVNQSNKTFSQLAEKLNTSENKASSYILIASDEFILKSTPDFSKYLKCMELSKCKSFVLRDQINWLNPQKVFEGVTALPIESINKIPEFNRENFFAIVDKKIFSKSLLKQDRIHQLDLGDLRSDELVLFLDVDHVNFLYDSVTKFAFNKVDFLKKYEQGYRINLTSYQTDPHNGILEKDIFIESKSQEIDSLISKAQ